MSTCKLCNNNISKTYQRNKRKELDVNFLLRTRAAQIKHDKNRKTIISDDLPNLLIKAWENQNGLCYYTKLPLTFSGTYKSPYYLVVDRIIPEKGYVDGNIALCCNAINKIKSSFTIDELKWWVNQIK